MKYLLLLTMLSGCAYMNNGFVSVPDGCEMNSYRQSDGTLKYYFTGNNCTEAERNFRGMYGSKN